MSASGSVIIPRGCALTDLSKKHVVSPFGNKQGNGESNPNTYRCQNCNISTKKLLLVRPHIESFCGRCCDDTEWILEEIQNATDEQFTNPTSKFSPDSKVKLEVGGKIFCTTVGTLTDEPTSSLFTALFSNRFTVHDLTSSTIKIDRSSKWFQQVIDFCRQGTLSPLYSVRDLLEIEEEAGFYGLDRLENYCKAERALRNEKKMSDVEIRQLSADFDQVLECQKIVQERLTCLPVSNSTDPGAVIRLVETLQGSVSEALHLVSASDHDSRSTDSCKDFLDECNSITMEQNSITDKLDYLNETIMLTSPDRALSDDQRQTTLKILNSLQLSLLHAIELLGSEKDPVQMVQPECEAPATERTLREVLEEDCCWDDSHFLATDEKSVSTGIQHTDVAAVASPLRYLSEPFRHFRQSEERVLSGCIPQNQLPIARSTSSCNPPPPPCFDDNFNKNRSDYQQEASISYATGPGSVYASEEEEEEGDSQCIIAKSIIEPKRAWSSGVTDVPEIEPVGDEQRQQQQQQQQQQRHTEALSLISFKLDQQATDIESIKTMLSRQFVGVGALFGLTIAYRLLKG